MERKQKNNPKLSKDLIVRRAIAVADTDGFEKLSMRRLASTLDVEAMSLYHYFPNKKELVSAMVDELIPALDPPDCVDDWQVAMKKRAHVIRGVFVTHPWMAHELVSGINVGPAMLAYTDTSIGYLVNAGFTYQMADYAWNVIDSYIYGFNMQAQNFPLEPDEYKTAAQQFLPMIPRSDYPFLHGMSMQIITGTHDGVQDFDFGLNIILSSLEELRKRTNNNKEQI